MKYSVEKDLMTDSLTMAQDFPDNVARLVLEAIQMSTNSPAIEGTIDKLLDLLEGQLRLTDARIVAPDQTECYATVKRFERAAVDGALPIRGRNEVVRQVFGSGQCQICGNGKVQAINAHGQEWHDYRGVITIAVPICWHDGVIGALVSSGSDQVDCTLDQACYVMRVVASLVGQLMNIHRMVAAQLRQLRRDNARLRQSELEVDGAVYGIVGQSQALRQALSDATKSARSSATVMLIGESGCGKERFSRMIHLASERRDAPFVCLNCAAIPRDLLESELFGHEKGSFTGATNSRKGKFELASGGTLFLDEIGDMPVDLQSKLLRVLQERTVQRIGGKTEIPVDVRIICATHRQMDEAIKSGSFRLDLYYRLNVLPIHLPPLRSRQGDVELLALYFLSRYNQQQRRNVVLTPAALNLLEAYEWPGNVRQLENCIERLVIMTDTDLIGAEEIDSLLTKETRMNFEGGDGALVSDRNDSDHASDSLSNGGPEAYRPYQRVDDSDRGTIIGALSRAQGNKTLAARMLGLTPRQLHYRLNKLDIQ